MLYYSIAYIIISLSKCFMLTISTHADADALAEPAILTPVPVDPQDVALLVLGAWSVLDLLLDAPAEKTL